MTFYPGYTAHTVLDEYASRFFVLLERGAEIERERKRWQLVNISYPYLSENTKRQIMVSLGNTSPQEPDTMTVKRDRKKLRGLLKKKGVK